MKDAGPWALNPGDYVHVQQLIVTGADGYAVFEVSDGSSFEVFPNSKVTFRANPPNWRDLLDVMIGRVKVHIQKMTGGQPNPNRIHTPTALICVRGTVFDVVVDSADETTLVAVEEGTVEVSHARLPSGDPKILNAGDSIRVYKNQPLARSRIDKGSAVNAALRGTADAIMQVLYRNRLPGGRGTGPTGPVGDTEAPPPPPPPDEVPPPPPLD